MILVPVMLLFILVYINYMSYTDLAIDKYNNGDNNL